MKLGAALPAALLALAMSSAMAIGGVYVSRRHVAAARAAGAGAGLLTAAESAAIESIVAWDSTARLAQAIGETVELAIADEGVTRVWVTRTADSQYWLVAESRTGAHSAPVLRARVGVVVLFEAGRAKVAFPRGWSQIP